MKIWHDDVRPPPRGWVWVQTNEDALHILHGCFAYVEEISLDHDLGADPYEADGIMLQGHAEETGLSLVKTMVHLHLVPPRVTIHSWNPIGARHMAEYLNTSGYDVIVAPYVHP